MTMHQWDPFSQPANHPDNKNIFVEVSILQYFKDAIDVIRLVICLFYVFIRLH